MNLSSWAQWKCTTFRCFPVYFDMFTGVIYMPLFIVHEIKQCIIQECLWLINNPSYCYLITASQEGHLEIVKALIAAQGVMIFKFVPVIVWSLFQNKHSKSTIFFTTVQTIFLFKNDGNYVESINQVNQVVILHLQM